MSDERLRQAERLFQETGSVEDEARYLLERVRAGSLNRERLELAAYCGHEASKLAVGGQEPEIAAGGGWEAQRDQATAWLLAVPRPFSRRVALICARLVSPAWEEFFPESPVSPASVLHLADALLDGTDAAAVEERLQREIAALEAEEVRRGYEVAWTDGERAIVAARAAVKAARFLHESLDVDPVRRVWAVAQDAAFARPEPYPDLRDVRRAGWQTLLTSLRSAVSAWALRS